MVMRKKSARESKTLEFLAKKSGSPLNLIIHGIRELRKVSNHL
jgi:hypothetical protein